MNEQQHIDVVVGAASGMGAAAARAIKGSRRLLVADRDATAVRRIAQELNAEPVELDITDPAALNDLGRRIGRLGKLIVTAGVSMAPTQPTLDINLIGTARLLQSLDHAVGEGTAAVLFSSMVELFPVDPAVAAVLDDPLAPDLAGRLASAGADLDNSGMAYVLSKIGVVRLARRTSNPWWKRGARILSVCPGLIDTPMSAKTVDRPEVQSMLDIVGRMGKPEEVAAVAAFLASEAASFVTGIDVRVDGGYVAEMSSALERQTVDQ